ncbi:DUF4326 domain-containing protein [Arthrobacter sp. lap29]|uniref:DUF4326 domain-containing protein n=1 Tax=Arthrobacter sp. lap29 TaxID=3056122 RepID=UPI0028F6DB9C|nr:DUF4326 domain-containing protein [Arthrobacter sp. lap29]
MTALKRIQRKRIAGWRMPANTVYVGRGTAWGNPYKVEKFRDGLSDAAFKVYEPEIDRLHTFFYDDVSDYALHGKPAAKKAVDLYLIHWLPLADVAELKAALSGKNLSCWCPLDQPCHADVLLELANQENPMPTTPNPLQTKIVGVEQPNPRIKAAAQALLEASKRDLPEGMAEKFDDVTWQVFEADAVAALAAADAVDPLRQPGHRVEISGFQWTLQHPAECRPNLLDCILTRATAAHGVSSISDGVWTVWLGEDQELCFSEYVAQ